MSLLRGGVHHNNGVPLREVSTSERQEKEREREREREREKEREMTGRRIVREERARTSCTSTDKTRPGLS